MLTHGFVLGQFGLLWAAKHAGTLENLAILGTPLGKKTALRPELAAYKNPVPFLRPKPDAKFAGDLYNAAGLAYVISYDDAQVRRASDTPRRLCCRWQVCRRWLPTLCAGGSLARLVC